MGSQTPRLRLAARAHPGARREAVELLPDGSLNVWVRARPVEGQANAALERVVAAALGLPPRQVRVVRGWSARAKVVEVDRLSFDEVRARLVARSVRSAEAYAGDEAG